MTTGISDRYYAGIGSRKTPENVCEAMRILAKKLELMGFTLRSGGAIGADQAFESGVKSNKEIFLPWQGYEGNASLLYDPHEKAEAISRQLFPHFPGVSRGTRLMISRNMHQILGPEPFVSPKSEFVICWTENGKAKGGTAYAMKAARKFDVPIFNLYNHVDRINLHIFLDDLTTPVDSSPE